MATGGVIRELEVKVPADLVRECPGLAMDIGGSVAKIVYRSKGDWEAVQNKDVQTGNLHLLSCAATSLDEVLVKVKEDVYMTRNGDEPTEIFTVGIGCHQRMGKLNKELNVKLLNVMETDCFIKSFMYLAKRNPFHELVQAPFPNVLAEVEHHKVDLVKGLEEWSAVSAMKMDLSEAKKLIMKEETSDPYASDLSMADMFGETMYPCMLAMLGSAFGFMKVEADGSFSNPGMSIRGGRTLLGLGSLLLKARSYDEIVELASKGNHFNLTTSNLGFDMAEAGENSDENSAYSVMDDTMERPLFTFGKAVDKDLSDFKREDVAAALVRMSIIDTVQCLFDTCVRQKIPRVFVAGSYANHPYMREKFTSEWKMWQAEMIGFCEVDMSVDIHFLTHGSHLGALGALINNLEGFIAKDGSVPTEGKDGSVPKEGKDGNVPTDGKDGSVPTEGKDGDAAEHGKDA